MLKTIWQYINSVWQKMTSPGMYEVLEYESTLELLDDEGKKATFRKRELVRYLQDNIIAYQDQGWGDGEILLNYRCSPGVPVDRYRFGYKTYILLSLRDVKNRGDLDEFNMEWRIRRGFLRRTEQWETEVRHRTKHIKIRVIFPKSRPPRFASIVQSSDQRTIELGEGSRKRLPDGRWLVTAGQDRTARVWDLAAKQPEDSVLVLRGGGQGIDKLAVSPDGRWVVTAGDGNTARLWDLNIDALIDRARPFASRELTPEERKKFGVKR